MAFDHRSWWRFLFRTSHKILLHRLVDPRLSRLGGDVLVVGAGAEDYRALLTQARRVVVTDVANGATKLDLIADTQELPFSDNSFDAVVAIEVFEHLRDPEAASHELFRVLRAGGMGLISVPFLFRIHGDPGDYFRFTGGAIRNMFSGFSSIEVGAFGGRIHVIWDLVCTAHVCLVPLRLLNWVLSGAIFARPSPDAPSGYVIELVK